MGGRRFLTSPPRPKGPPPAPELTVEQASAMAVVATVADVETWLTGNTDPDGRVGVVDLIRVLDVFRESALPDLPEEG